jgi:hypothetical protein
MADCMERIEKEGSLLYFKKMVVSVSSCREVKYKVFCSQSPREILNFFPVLSRSNIKNSSDDSANYAKNVATRETSISIAFFTHCTNYRKVME